MKCDYQLWFDNFNLTLPKSVGKIEIEMENQIYFPFNIVSLPNSLLNDIFPGGIITQLVYGDVFLAT